LASLLDTDVVSQPIKVTPDPRVMQWLGAFRIKRPTSASLLSRKFEPGIELLPAGRKRRDLESWLDHTNVKTPRWIGYVFQRPEMHRIHHEYAMHRNNYGDIVWWDMLFGTYENPKEFTTHCGFDDEKEQELIPMLQFKDVHK
jgi:hypothetical protein